MTRCRHPWLASIRAHEAAMAALARAVEKVLTDKGMSKW